MQHKFLHENSSHKATRYATQPMRFTIIGPAFQVKYPHICSGILLHIWLFLIYN